MRPSWVPDCNPAYIGAYNVSGETRNTSHDERSRNILESRIETSPASSGCTLGVPSKLHGVQPRAARVRYAMRIYGFPETHFGTDIGMLLQGPRWNGRQSAWLALTVETTHERDVKGARAANCGERPSGQEGPP